MNLQVSKIYYYIIGKRVLLWLCSCQRVTMGTVSNNERKGGLYFEDFFCKLSSAKFVVYFYKRVGSLKAPSQTEKKTIKIWLVKLSGLCMSPVLLSLGY